MAKSWPLKVEDQVPRITARNLSVLSAHS